MEATAILRSFPGAFISNAPLRTKASFSQGPVIGSRRRLLPYVKASENALSLTSDGVTLEKSSPGPLENKQKSAFPYGFEALIHDVCDETNIAELKLKVGSFEMCLKRNIETPAAPIPAASVASPATTPPPVPCEPKVESGHSAESASSSPFASVSSSTALKLASLDASVSKSYVLVTSPTVGSFRSGRTVKGVKKPPCCKEGDIIKEGQVIGYLDQFEYEMPIRSNVAGEVLKMLVKERDAVGYKDPMVAVLPSFHGLK